MDTENKPTTEQPLSEKDFIQEEYGKNPFPFWFWLFLVTTFSALVWGGISWVSQLTTLDVTNKPFLNVTNREMSLFLWQNPSYMRANVPNKSGYLTGFQYIKKQNIEPNFADLQVVAPPNLLFHYHTWSRLLVDEFIQRKIPIVEFMQFLEYVEEWQPKNWLKAPAEYRKLVEGLPQASVQDLNALPESTLPNEVRMAFVGWKNYFNEGEQINALKPTYAGMQAFLSAHPRYARNFWRNIADVGNIHYLQTLTLKTFDPKAIIPDDELTPFLKVALFNYQQAQAGR